MQEPAYTVLLAHAAACRTRIDSAVRGLVAKIPATLRIGSPRDVACLELLRNPAHAGGDALHLTPDGEPLLASGPPAALPESDLRDAAARIDELEEAQLQSLAVLVLDGLRHWRTFNLLSGDLQSAMQDEVPAMDARGSAAALFMRGEGAADELLGLACLLGGQEADEVRAEIDAIARRMVDAACTSEKGQPAGPAAP